MSDFVLMSTISSDSHSLISSRLLFLVFTKSEPEAFVILVKFYSTAAKGCSTLYLHRSLANITDPDQARLSETLIIENCFRHATTWWRRCRPRIPVGRTQGQ